MQSSKIRDRIEGLLAATCELDHGLRQLLDAESDPDEETLRHFLEALRDMHRAARKLRPGLLARIWRRLRRAL
jgi:hypothetical protein